MFDTAYYKILNAVGDIRERILCHNVLFYVTNIFLWFVRSDKNKHNFFLMLDWVVKDTS